MSLDISARVDESTASLGKRYARADEVGIPFAITIDFETVSGGTVTLRDRDSMSQIRAKTDEVINLVKMMCTEQMVWEEAVKKYGLVAGGDEEGEGKKAAPKEATFVESTGRGRFSRPSVV